jgi:ketosteroid isomerase-like protein
MRVLAILLAASTFVPAPVLALAVDDEQLLKDTVQQLARAWTQHDRAFIENVLAPEWVVTQADGTMLTRSSVLGAFFDAVKFDSNVIDDVTVALFGDTAIVRGRTVATATLNGAPVTARIRFTDVFIKRNGRWQVVASHASPLTAAPLG